MVGGKFSHVEGRGGKNTGGRGRFVHQVNVVKGATPRRRHADEWRRKVIKICLENGRKGGGDSGVFPILGPANRKETHIFPHLGEKKLSRIFLMSREKRGQKVHSAIGGKLLKRDGKGNVPWTKVERGKAT